MRKEIKEHTENAKEIIGQERIEYVEEREWGL
jgi:hypothetical protein